MSECVYSRVAYTVVCVIIMLHNGPVIQGLHNSSVEMCSVSRLYIE